MSKLKAFDTCEEMFLQRGYKILNKDTETMRLTALKQDNTNVIGIFNSMPKFDTKSMKEVFSLMYELQIKHCIVIYQDGITAATKSTLVHAQEMRIELFHEEDLQINITKHCLQPIFQKMSNEEAEEFKRKFGVKFGILRFDKPISNFYDYKKGDVIRIIRKDNSIGYRIVK